jgi:hypothetical protein
MNRARGVEMTLLRKIFYRSKISSFSADVTIKDDEIPAHRPSYPMRVLLFWSMCNHDVHIRYFFTFGNIASVDEEHGISALDVAMVAALCKAPDLVTVGIDPILSLTALAQLLVLCKLASVWIKCVAM